MHHKKHFSSTALRKLLSEHFRQIDDRRQSGKVDYRLHDYLMSGFAMMFFQDPSLLAFQMRMQDSIQHNNLTTVYDVSKIPKESQMREVLDCVDPVDLSPIFSDLLSRLQQGKHLVNCQLFKGKYLISIDGSEYFSSENIQCPHCLITESKGKQRYHHQILQSVIVNPDMRQVIPLAPEQISTLTVPKNKIVK